MNKKGSLQKSVKVTPSALGGNYGFEVKDSFPKYNNLVTHSLTFNGQKIPFQAVVRDGKLINIFSDRYQILPNEDALNIGNDVAKEFGLIPASQGSDDLYYCKPRSVMFNDQKTAMTALYVNPQGVNIAGPGEKEDMIFKGMALRNSIDGWSAFTVSVFTFRKICQNMAFHFASAKSLRITEYEIADASPHVVAPEQRALTVASAKVNHTSSLDAKLAGEAVRKVLSAGDDILFRYKVMKNEKLLEEQAKRIALNVAHKVTEKLNWLHVEKSKDGSKVKKVSFDSKVTSWKAFNDITDVLTHQDDLFGKKKLGFENTQRMFAFADSILVRKSLPGLKK